MAGFLTYTFNKHFTLGVGSGRCPACAPPRDSLPAWLTVDHRLIGDEFFRPSYTIGVLQRARSSGLNTSVMLGNNLSQLGVDAGQLGNDLNTCVGLRWSGCRRPASTGHRRLRRFRGHEELATRIGSRYTRSDENFQGQPDTEAPDNVQIRLSDGNIVFTPDCSGGASGSSTSSTRWSRSMRASSTVASRSRASTTGAGEGFRGPDAELPSTTCTDTGFQLQASAMVVPKRRRSICPARRSSATTAIRPTCASASTSSPGRTRWSAGTRNYLLEPFAGGLPDRPLSRRRPGPVFHSNLEVNF